MPIDIAYLLFLPAAAVCFWRLATRIAILAVFFGGWLLLPVGHYGPLAEALRAPWSVPVLAVPTAMLLSKAWIAPLVALVGGAIVDRSSVMRWRPGLPDAFMLGWCLWPLTALLAPDPAPAPLLASAYLAGSWGLTWLLGRIWFCEREGRMSLLAGLGWAGAACLPLALAEGLFGPFLYDRLYQPHPFRYDGADRYLGFRPIGLFEHGNQYGIWVALCALAALWTAIALRRNRSIHAVVAVVTLAIAVAAQSVGALLLLLLGLLLLTMWRSRLAKVAAATALVTIALLGAVYISGRLPLRQLGDTPVGRMARSAIDGTGRHSLIWRVARDADTMHAARVAPIAGTGRWDWWRPLAMRPWGLVLLLAPQVGFVGLLLAFGTLVGAAIGAIGRLRIDSGWEPAAAPLALALIVLLALGDALLNAFFFFPAILAAGAIATRTARPYAITVDRNARRLQGAGEAAR